MQTCAQKAMARKGETHYQDMQILQADVWNTQGYGCSHPRNSQVQILCSR